MKLILKEKKLPQNKCPQLVSIGSTAVDKHIGHDMWAFWLRLLLDVWLVNCEFVWDKGGALGSKWRNPSISFTESECNCGFSCCIENILPLLKEILKFHIYLVKRC